jgi:ATP phosphoribosyltransferase regulatory subunit HisZ
MKTGVLTMKQKSTQKMIATLAVCAISFFSASAIAGLDESQRQMTQRVLQSKQMLQQAETAKGAERQKLMSNHMKMMQEIMGKMQAMKPRAGMTMQEHEGWVNEHQKLMDDMMGQMMEEQQMMMDTGCMSMEMGGMHNH